MPSTRRAALILSGVAGAAAAVVLLVFTLRSGESEPFKGAGDRLPPTPSGLVMPTGPLQFYLATILRPPAGQAMPSEISMEGETLPYDPATVFQRIQGTPEGWQWRIRYWEPNSSETSALILDWTGAVVSQHILPWHASIFQPLLDYAGVALEVRTDVPAPTPTPVPTAGEPIVIAIAGKKVTLPPGMKYSEVLIPPPGTDPSTFSPYQTMSYRIGSTYSELRIDGTGRVKYARILPEHLELFQPLLNAALPPLRDTVTIYGQTLTLPSGMRFWEGIRQGTTNPIWTVEYMSIPAQPEISYIAVDTETGNVYRSHINPGDEPLFQPLLDIAASARP